MTQNIENYTTLSLQIRWNRIRVANVFDALDSMGYCNQCLDLNIRPFLPTNHLAGLAVTIRGIRDPVDYERKEIKTRKNDENIFDGSPDIRNYIFPGAVLVVDGGGELVSGKMGEMTSWCFKQAGAKGVVVDGYIRDRLGLDVIEDYCVCARGTSPIESNKRWHVDSVNVPITIPGTLTHQVPIFPNDWVIGGDDGVIVVPQAIANEVLILAEDIENREEGMRKDLAAGLPFNEVYGKWGRS